MKYIIVGLRATHPTPGGLMLPGYLTKATENHRYGFQLPGSKQWFAFTSEPLNAEMFDYEDWAVELAKLLAKNDRGDFRPLTIMKVYV